MTKRVRIVTICLSLVGLTVGLFGCAPEEYRPLRPEAAYEGAALISASPGVWRVIDEEAGVICYTTNDYRGGISCLPIAATKMEAR